MISWLHRERCFIGKAKHSKDCSALCLPPIQLDAFTSSETSLMSLEHLDAQWIANHKTLFCEAVAINSSILHPISIIGCTSSHRNGIGLPIFNLPHTLYSGMIEDRGSLAFKSARFVLCIGFRPLLDSQRASWSPIVIVMYEYSLCSVASLMGIPKLGFFSSPRLASLGSPFHHAEPVP